nr:hypothetical protein [Tanacetum cinerariifolium]
KLKDEPLGPREENARLSSLKRDYHYIHLSTTLLRKLNIFLSIQDFQLMKFRKKLKRIDIAWEGLSLNDWIRVRYEKVCEMTKERILKNYCRQEFNENQDDMIDMNVDLVQEIRTVADEEDFDGIVDYLELKTHDGFIDIHDESYKERMCKWLGMTYKMPPLIMIKKVEVTRLLSQEFNNRDHLG